MSKRTAWMVVLGLVVAATFVMTQVLLVVREGEAVVRTTFGRPESPALTKAGLYLRWPAPIQKPYRFDTRVQMLDGSFEQTLTRDGRTLVATLYAGWRISDPIRFLERVGSIEQARRNLNGLLSNARNAVIGQHPFSALVSTDPAQLQFERIEADILAAAAPAARERYGVELVRVGLRKISLPEAITEKVFARMRQERKAVAERYLSEGDAEALRIRAQADSLREQKIAAAEADARRVRAEGDAAAAEYYKIFEEDPELAMFLRKLEVLEQTLNEKSTVVLGPETEPFDLLGSGASVPATGWSTPVTP